MVIRLTSKLRRGTGLAVPACKHFIPAKNSAFYSPRTPSKAWQIILRPGRFSFTKKNVRNTQAPASPSNYASCRLCLKRSVETRAAQTRARVEQRHRCDHHAIACKFGRKISPRAQRRSRMLHRPRRARVKINPHENPRARGCRRKTVCSAKRRSGREKLRCRERPFRLWRCESPPRLQT